MKKRALAVLLALVVVVTLLPVVNAFASSTMYVSTSNGKSLNMRDYPSKDGNVIANIPYGAKVTVDEDFIGSSWVHVYYKSADGYCMVRYLSTYKPGPKPQPTQPPSPTQPSGSIYDNLVQCYYTATVQPSSAGGFVHLRWAPSKNQPIQRDYYNGSQLVVIAQDGTCVRYMTSQLMFPAL